MISFPNAKINLGLNIVSKRADGYHNLETIFYPIGIKDALEIISSKKGEDCFYQKGLQLDVSSDDNLVMKALKLMRKYHFIPAIDVYLLKKIPFGAGIGGGSADAAFMLRLLNDSFSLGLDKDTLSAMALQLGADCPFFIYNKPMFAKGIGEVLEGIALSLTEYYLVLVKPDIHIPTKDAFALIQPHKPNVSLKEIVQKPVEEWKDLLYNDFEKSIFPRYPEIGDIKNQLYKSGAIYASMSGSGSSVFGIFKQRTIIQPLFPDYYVWEEEK